MAKRHITRREALAKSVPLLCALPAAGLVGPELAAAAAMNHGSSPGKASGDGKLDPQSLSAHGVHGAGAPVSIGSGALDALTYPPPPTRRRPGKTRQFEIVAQARDIEIIKGVTFPAWTYNGTVPGPILRVNEGEILKVDFRNATQHPHTIHFHGIHPANMDGVFEVIAPGDEFVYEFEARPAGVHPYHCHVPPLREHIQRGLYGTLIIDPKEGRKPAKEIVMVMNGYDTDKDGENNFYTVNGVAFYYAKYPIKVKRSETVRIYLVNMTEFDAVNSFHLHGEFFRYQENGRSTNAWRETDNVAQIQGERGVIEIDFNNAGMFMFHAHQTEFIELGWTGFFDVEDA